MKEENVLVQLFPIQLVKPLVRNIGTYDGRFAYEDIDPTF